MAGFSSVGSMIASMALNLAVYHLFDRWFHDRLETIATGLVRGVQVPSEHRRLLLHTSWMESVTVQISFLTLSAYGWVQLSGTASTEGTRVFAQLFAFFAAMGALGWLALAPFWYFRLRRVVRRAESD